MTGDQPPREPNLDPATVTGRRKGDAEGGDLSDPSGSVSDALRRKKALGGDDVGGAGAGPDAGSAGPTDADRAADEDIGGGGDIGG